MWATEDLDRIHKLLIEQECEVTIIYRSEKYLNVSNVSKTNFIQQ